MKACKLIEQLAIVVSQYGDMDVNVVFKNGDEIYCMNDSVVFGVDVPLFGKPTVTLNVKKPMKEHHNDIIEIEEQLKEKNEPDGVL